MRLVDALQTRDRTPAKPTLPPEQHDSRQPVSTEAGQLRNDCTVATQPERTGRKLSTSVVRQVNRVLRSLGLQVLRAGATSGISQRRVAASRAVFESLGGEIQSGPLAGTRLTSKFAWGDASVGAVVIGCYEEQLHQPLEELIAGSPDLIVNIGSAEGTYAVGLARRLPDAQVLAVDVEAVALEAVRANAALNGVEARVRAVLNLDPAGLEAILRESVRPAVFVDCEGCEKTFLDPLLVPSLQRAPVLVELHEAIVPGIGSLLKERLSGTHKIVEITESGRNPHQYELLRPMSSIDKWLLVSEGRSETMTWLWCTPLPVEQR